MEYKKNSRLVLLFIYFLFMLMKKIDVKMILFLKYRVVKINVCINYLVFVIFVDIELIV